LIFGKALTLYGNRLEPLRAAFEIGNSIVEIDPASPILAVKARKATRYLKKR
jgi:hypothetical protein